MRCRAQRWQEVKSRCDQRLCGPEEGLWRPHSAGPVVGGSGREADRLGPPPRFPSLRVLQILDKDGDVFVTVNLKRN